MSTTLAASASGHSASTLNARIAQGRKMLTDYKCEIRVFKSRGIENLADWEFKRLATLTLHSKKIELVLAYEEGKVMTDGM
jgi:uncharacterized protein (DUF2345 family)